MAHPLSTLDPRAWIRTARDVRDHFRFPRVSNTVRGVYPDFATAARAAPRDRKLGYDHASHAEMYDHRIGKLAIGDYPTLFWLSRVLPESASVFDFGGHVGLHYYGFAPRLTLPPELAWVVCDVPSTVARGRTLAAARGAANLRFTAEWGDGDGSDVLIASGVLQYVEEDLAARLRRWTRLPRHVIVATTPMYDGPSYVTLQNTDLSYCPYRVFNRGELVSSIEALGYEVVDAWSTERSLRVPFRPERSVRAYQGIYLRRRAPSTAPGT